MKKLLSLFLVLALCIPVIAINGITETTVAAASSHVYMIVTNPGQDMNTQMNISFHSDYTYTGCYVEYTTANDTSFAGAKKATGSYDSDDYMWFYNRYTTSSTSSAKFTTKFLNYNVDLSGLTPNTKYIYRICDGAGAYSETYAFKTAGQSQFSMIWLSDIHITHTETTKQTKYQNAINWVENNAKYEIGLNINTGDVVASGDRYKFWQQFYSPAVYKKYPYASTVGNHDLYDNMMDDDPEYTQYWKGGEYFRITANYPDNGYVQTSGRISGYLNGDGYSSHASKSSSILFDPGSGNLAGKYITGAKEDLNGRAYWFLYNRILYISFDYYAMTQSAEKENAFNWAYGVIDANKGKYDYLMASFHVNMIWGDGGNSRYYDDYKNFLDTANVDIFLCGDNHIYYRSDKLLNGAKTTDPEKGTVIIQAPAITNVSTYPTYTGAKEPYGVSRYSSADYVGAFVIDVDSSGMHFKLGIGSGTGANMATHETFTIAKKVRYSDAVTGIYTAPGALTVKETSDASAQSLTTIPAGTVFEVNEGNGQWGRVRYNGFTGWVNLGGISPTHYTTDVSAPEQFEISNVNVGYASAHLVNAYTPAYGSTIANGGWLFSGNVTITGVRDSNGAYKVTAHDTSGNAKNTTPIPANGCVFLINKSYPNYNSLMATLTVGSYFTLDSNRTTVYTANPGEANVTPNIPGTEPEVPETITLKEGTSYTKDTYIKNVSTSTKVSDFITQLDNTTVKVFNVSGAEVAATATIGSGYTVKCYDTAGKETDSCAIIVYGDIDGDGNCSTTDCLTLRKVISGDGEFEGHYATAGDVSLDNYISTTDLAIFLKMLSGN